ncbi:ACT domain-containing protein [Campylobacter jejuni]|uniref:ACT domain-containing protein n=1 Tax=Campylobacter jejuni TaxID=197 RepID=UPI001BDBAA01|nr:ACT domain-containing protein [Campylobacter jejuni]
MKYHSDRIGPQDESVSHRSILEVQVVAADGTTATVAGALTGLEHVEKIVRINHRGLDLRATGTNLFLVYPDQPGALGKVGTLLGNKGINIDAAALSPTDDEQTATLVLRVSEELDQQLVEEVKAELDASNAFVLNL